MRCATRIGLPKALSNLLGNAMQHGARGPITVTMRDRAPDTVAIAVHNLGHPIPERLQAVIFDAFRLELDDSGSSSQSIGLGLFITNEIVRRHGGSLVVAFPDRDGTTFTALLPRTPVAAASEPTPPTFAE
jgi:signal transduction histidine kinase